MPHESHQDYTPEALPAAPDIGDTLRHDWKIYGIYKEVLHEGVIDFDTKSGRGLLVRGSLVYIMLHAGNIIMTTFAPEKEYR